MQHGLGGVPLSQAVLRQVLSFDRRNLKAMLCMKKRSGETWELYHRRQNQFLRIFLGKVGCMELAARLLAKQYGWAGHMARLPEHHVAAQWGRAGTLEQWHSTQTIGTQLDPSNKTKWRHKVKGAKVHWESLLARLLGDTWRHQAMDRKGWRKDRQHFLERAGQILLGEGAKLLGTSLSVGPSTASLTACATHLQQAPPAQPALQDSTSDDGPFGHLFVERGVAKNALSHFSHTPILQFIGDSDVLISALLGRASCKDEALLRLLKVAHVGMQTLTQSLKIRPPGAELLARHVRRADNSAADAAANWALDHGSFTDFRVHEAASFAKCLATTACDNVGLLFSFDGAARGNPGPASTGVCVHGGAFSTMVSFYLKVWYCRKVSVWDLLPAIVQRPQP